MFGLFGNISDFIKKIKNKLNKLNKKDENNPEYRIKFAQRIADKKIRYVSERIVDGMTGEVADTIIGKDAFFNINKNNELSVYMSGSKGGKELFRAYIPDLKASELMSLDGVILESFDLLSNKERRIIAYYKYYR